MEIKVIIFWIMVIIVAWFGLRNLITIIVGESQYAPLKPGQRLCHATSLAIFWGSCVAAIYYRIWWPLLVGFVAEAILRNIVIWSGEVASKEEKDSH